MDFDERFRITFNVSQQEDTILTKLWFSDVDLQVLCYLYFYDNFGKCSFTVTSKTNLEGRSAQPELEYR